MLEGHLRVVLFVAMLYTYLPLLQELLINEVLWHYLVRAAGEVGTKLLPRGLAGSTEYRCLWQRTEVKV